MEAQDKNQTVRPKKNNVTHFVGFRVTAAEFDEIRRCFPDKGEVSDSLRAAFAPYLQARKAQREQEQRWLAKGRELEEQEQKLQQMKAG